MRWISLGSSSTPDDDNDDDDPHGEHVPCKTKAVGKQFRLLSLPPTPNTHSLNTRSQSPRHPPRWLVVGIVKPHKIHWPFVYCNSLFMANQIALPSSGQKHCYQTVSSASLVYFNKTLQRGCIWWTSFQLWSSVATSPLLLILLLLYKDRLFRCMSPQQERTKVSGVIR